jgi:uncharacterized OsmC-like protein
MARLQVSACVREKLPVEVSVRQHRIVADLPPDKGGNDSGPTPPEILLASLAACAAIFAKMFAQRESLSGEITVAAEAELTDFPMLISNFSVRVRIPGLPKEKRDKAHAFIDKCVVSETLCAGHHVSLLVEG